MKEPNKCVVLLQNAWSEMYAGKAWPRESWLKALHHSLTGRRLSTIFSGSAIRVWYDNTTPEVGFAAKSRIPPDPDHVLGTLARNNPRFVLACGAQAGKIAAELWPGRLILMPHPAWRLMTPELLLTVRGLIWDNKFGRCQVTSTARGQISVNRLDGG